MNMTLLILFQMTILTLVLILDYNPYYIYIYIFRIGVYMKNTYELICNLLYICGKRKIQDHGRLPINYEKNTLDI